MTYKLVSWDNKVKKELGLLTIYKKNAISRLEAGSEDIKDFSFAASPC